MLVSACGRSTDEQVTAQVAVAKEAADRAVAAQKAAEHAAKQLMARANPGSFGEDGGDEALDDSPSAESAEPVDDTGGMDVSVDTGSSSGDSTSGVPQ
jgi:hypothetical protein